jgi:hypothetical protein
MPNTSSSAMLAVLGAAGLWLAQPAVHAQEPANESQFGTVHFQTSCNDTAQRRFDRAMRYQHSFWYKASREIFEDVLKADSDCAIAYWGIALSLLYNPHSPPTADNLPLGLAALQKGKAVGAKTQRERDYIEALSALYTDYDKIDHRTRVQAYLKAMERLAQRYPSDDEAQIYYALALNVAASPADKTLANQIKGTQILEPIFRRQPQHPGVAHYLIHLYDYPAIAEKGLDAAKRYAEIAPAAPHAQHMPTHIFTRVGYWPESIASNAASARAAKLGKDFDEQMHAMDYMVYAYLQQAQDKKALSVIEEMRGISDFNPNVLLGPYALAASAARYVLERGDWAAAAASEIRPSKFPQVDAITHFARALGAARLGTPEAARADIAKLSELRERLRQAKDAYWAEQVDIQVQVASAWLLYAEGKYDDALAAMSAAADAEDRSEKHVVTPGAPKSARDLYGVMLLERGKAAEALVAFEMMLKKEPNRLDAVIGAGRAAQTLGDPTKARQYYARAVALAEGADPLRPEVAAARAFVSKN